MSRQSARIFRRIAGNSTGIEALRVTILACLSALLWMALMNRWTADAWRTPVTYTGEPEKADVMFIFAGVKAAEEGDFKLCISKIIPRLGAPFEASWNDFPVVEEFGVIIPGLLSRAVGLFTAVNIALAFAFVLAACAFYATCRLLGCLWEWAFAGGIVFAFSTYAFAHGSHHLLVTYYWHVPLCLLVTRWVSLDDGIELGGRRFLWALAIGFVTGLQHVYYTNMFAQLVLLGGLVQGFRHGWKRALPALSIVAAAAAGFFLMNVDTIAYQFSQGPNSGAVVRNYGWLEYYGLKLVDLVIPFPTHRWPLFAEWGTSYYTQVSLKGEVPPPAYLGLVGNAALAGLIVVCFRRLIAKPPRTLPLEAWQALWIFAYATVGGLNGLAGSLGIQLFRSTTRYSIFILALVLIFAARKLSALRKNHPLSHAGFAAFAVLIALWDQTPPQPTPEDLRKTEEAVASDREFTQQIEARLPRGAMVFQIPVMDFPESPAPGVSSYDHFRPYLLSERLRFSFGSVKGRPADEWQHELTKMDLRQAVARLESYGFSAIYINRNGLPDRGASLLAALRQLGRDEVIENRAGDLICVLLQPSPDPIQP